MPRFFVPKAAIHGDSAIITGEDVAHISKVLRMRVSDALTLCDGAGTDYDCTITEITKTQITLAVSAVGENQAEPQCCITLFQGLPKGTKMDYIIQKAVEVGVCRIVPMLTERVVARGDAKAARWQKIAEEAAKQSGRGIVPSVDGCVSFADAVRLSSEAQLALIPYEEEHAVTLRSILRGTKHESVSILIGPEGGFSCEEIALAQSQGLHAVTLGSRILRTETAGLATAANILYEYEE